MQAEGADVPPPPSLLVSHSGTGRRYIVDSGASFHMVDSCSLTKKERATVKDLPSPMVIHTANGDIQVTKQAQVYIVELHMHVWALLQKGTVSILSLGMLVDTHGFTYNWKPRQAPTLTKGKLRVSCEPQWNVPFIFPASVSNGISLEKSFPASSIEESSSSAVQAVASGPAKISSASSAVQAAATDESLETSEEIIAEELKDIPELIPDPPLEAPAGADTSAKSKRRGRQRL